MIIFYDFMIIFNDSSTLAWCHFVIISHFKYGAAVLLFIFKSFRIDTGQLDPGTNAISLERQREGGERREEVPAPFV